jgi:hypothetical protein
MHPSESASAQGLGSQLRIARCIILSLSAGLSSASGNGAKPAEMNRALRAALASRSVAPSRATTSLPGLARPDSRKLRCRGDTPASSASSNCESPASCRQCRSTFPKLLAQVHGFLTEKATPRTEWEWFMQAMLYSAYYGTYLAQPPVTVQKLLSFLVSPTARLLGYRSWYPAYSQKWKRSCCGAGCSASSWPATPKQPA